MPSKWEKWGGLEMAEIQRSLRDALEPVGSVSPTMSDTGVVVTPLVIHVPKGCNLNIILNEAQNQGPSEIDHPVETRCASLYSSGVPALFIQIRIKDDPQTVFGLRLLLDNPVSRDVTGELIEHGFLALVPDTAIPDNAKEGGSFGATAVVIQVRTSEVQAALAALYVMLTAGDEIPNIPGPRSATPC